ncbi:ABC transporter permease [Pelagovum pacificum]|uniref:ABC transporter permease n=1 Tax=Pelagovum pacificum TaxID=2588711 RepID=A0A5C5GGW0_9RHOB|nr:ABC transporter permease [Pelagovum pacificum]QQA43588.1 ABC transporter permease [Pelagovum pacificum]TNY33277.1 ABC transporter permease [Pelagovum pacificum]
MIQTFRQFGTLLGLIAIMIFFTAQLPGTFLTARNLINISQQVSMLAVVAFAMTIVMVMRDFDLSVGSMASLSGITAAMLFTLGFPVWQATGIALLVGVAGGLINGILVAYVGILPFVATLGTLTVYSGLAFFISDGRTIFGRDIPAGFSGYARSGPALDAIGLEGLRLPALTLTALAVLAAVWLLLEQTNFGRRLYAIGGNTEAARLAGIRVRRLKLAAFALTGLGAAGAGLMYAARVASANPTQGAGLMLDAIAAVFLGMTMGREGEPHVLATLVGVLILGILDNGLTQMQVDSYIREMLIGAIVLLAVATSSLGRRS